MSFKVVDPYNFDRSAFALIDKDWLLITAPDATKDSGASAMTASWAELGILWNKPVATIYIRPQRHTYSLCEASDRISLCVLPEEHRAAHKILGRQSGRDTDKLKECNLACTDIDGVKVVEQSRLAFICRKLYADDLKKDCFVDKEQHKHYPTDDFHRFYILEIEKILIKD